MVVGESVEGVLRRVPYASHDAEGRDAKTLLGSISPWQYTLYLDADTRPRVDPRVGFGILADGWDIVIIPSRCHGADWLWHVGGDERQATREETGGEHVTLGGGVIWWARNERTAALWAAWHAEWQRWAGQDQGALMRAYLANPCRIWLLSRAWNGGPCIEHRFGAAKARA
jgi:hypothetical protein